MLIEATRLIGGKLLPWHSASFAFLFLSTFLYRPKTSELPVSIAGAFPDVLLEEKWKDLQ